jgi:hypothetical protein
VLIAVFACQSAGVAALVIPDDCALVVGGTGADPCPDACTNCVCCGRIPFSLLPSPAAIPAESPIRETAPIVIDALSSAVPRGILHIPKAR